MAELFDAFDGSFAAGNGALQPARTFIRLRDELLGQIAAEEDVERSTACFVDRLRKLPEAQRGVLREFGRLAKPRMNDE